MTPHGRAALRGAAALTLAAGLAAPLAGNATAEASVVASRTWISAPAALPGLTGRNCSAPLSRGRAVVTRTTARVGNGDRRYWSAITLATTGNAWGLVVDRGVGTNPITRVIVRTARGATGTVSGVRSWGFGSRTGNVEVHVAGVDQATGRIVKITC